LAEDDTDRQREAFDEASQELHRAFAPLADLYTAYLMDGSLRPADYARLLTHFASGKTEKELWPDLRDAWQRIRKMGERHHFFHWPLGIPGRLWRRGCAGLQRNGGKSAVGRA